MLFEEKFGMRSLALVGLWLSLCTGFSPVKTVPRHDVSNLRSALYAANDGRDEVSFQRKMTGIAATLALGWSVGMSSSIAAPKSNLDWTPSVSNGGGSGFVVALSDSDFADFSLPSYQEVNAAEINTNLKGGKQLFGEVSPSAASSPSSSETAASAPVAEKKEPSAEDLKAGKAAAKAAAKAARERQQAAVEAAIAAKQ